MELGEIDGSGRRKPVPTGIYVTLKADTLISAIGEELDRELLETLGLPLDLSGAVRTDSETCETALPGVFLCGDARRGPSMVIEAAGVIRCCRRLLFRG